MKNIREDGKFKVKVEHFWRETLRKWLIDTYHFQETETVL